jgi:hypothetical protein
LAEREREEKRVERGRERVELERMVAEAVSAELQRRTQEVSIDQSQTDHAELVESNSSQTNYDESREIEVQIEVPSKLPVG